MFDPRYRSGATTLLIAAVAPIEPQAPLPTAAAAPVQPQAPLPIAAAPPIVQHEPVTPTILQWDVEEISLAVDESMDPKDVDVDEMLEEI